MVLYTVAATHRTCARTSVSLTPRQRRHSLVRVIDPDRLRTTYDEAAAKLPPDLELVGVTYHGPQHDPNWVALATASDGTACEGGGATPFQALTDLVRHVEDERRI